MGIIAVSKNWLLKLAVRHLSPTGPSEIRPNPGANLIGHSERCEDTDEVVGWGHLHVEQMDKGCYWACLSMPGEGDIVLWFKSKSSITLIAERD